MTKKVLILTATLLCGMAGAAYAQDARGTIVGRVTDASGAVLASVEVHASNTATGVVVNARTNESGNYSLPYLVPGLYNVTSEISGFKKFVRDNIQVRVGDTVELNIQMAVGDVAEKM